jgi:transcriptional regulator with XRE-family HTH domain
MSKTPDEVDAHIGARLRERRQSSGISQEQLGVALGLTFQQVQKYEKGLNRIGAGRLYRIAEILGVEVGYFYEGLHRGNGAAAAAPVNGRHTENDPVRSFLATPEGYHLSRAFARIDNPATRSRLLDLVRTIAESGDAKAS